MIGIVLFSTFLAISTLGFYAHSQKKLVDRYSIDLNFLNQKLQETLIESNALANALKTSYSKGWRAGFEDGKKFMEKV